VSNARFDPVEYAQAAIEIVVDLAGIRFSSGLKTPNEILMLTVLR
jgi:hypothetical protein